MEKIIQNVFSSSFVTISSSKTQSVFDRKYRIYGRLTNWPKLKAIYFCYFLLPPNSDTGKQGGGMINGILLYYRCFSRESAGLLGGGNNLGGIDLLFSC